MRDCSLFTRMDATKLYVPDKLKEGAFPNILFKSSKSGWINSELFVDWFAFVLKSIPPTRPV